MTSSAPVDEAALLEDLLERVSRASDVLAQTAPASEAARYLVPEAVSALDDNGLLKLKAPREVGGWGASTATQTQVLAALAEIDAAAAWSAMVSNNSSGFMGAYLTEAGIDEIFADGVPITSGVAAPTGRASATDGGLTVSGRWRLCSGVRQASWVRLTAMTEAEPKRPVFCVLPQSEVEIIDTWHVFGLRGTGSFDVTLDNCFVPMHRVITEQKRLRGIGSFRLVGQKAAAYEHTAIALGLGRRALAEMSQLVGARPDKQREVILNSLGRLSISLDAARALALMTFEKEGRLLEDESTDESLVGITGPAIGAHATEVALECAETAYRYAGSGALYAPNPFEKLVRDLHGATQHIAVQDTGFSEWGSVLAN